MAYFRLHYIDNSGKKMQKVVNLIDESQLQSYVQTASLNITDVEKLSSSRKLFELKSFLQGISITQTVEILESLQVIVRSGLPMNTSLLDLANDADNNRIRDMLTDIAYSLQMSMSLSEAMGRYEDVFTESTVGLVKIGEETGELENTLRDAAKYMARMADLRSKLKSALILPIITLIAMAGAFTFWIVGVLPSLIGMFESFDLQLPALTLFLLELSDFLRNYALQTVAGIIIAIIAFFVMRSKSESFRLLSDRGILKLPILGKTLKFYYYAFIAEYTRLMIAAGLPLYQALEILQQSTTNRVYKIGIGNARENISIGKTFSEALAEEKMFSSLIIRMINVGEQTGRLEGQLTYISKYYFDKVDYISENIAKIIQPFFTVILGGFMIVLMLGFLMPIWDLVSGLSNYN